MSVVRRVVQRVAQRPVDSVLESEGSPQWTPEVYFDSRIMFCGEARNILPGDAPAGRVQTWRDQGPRGLHQTAVDAASRPVLTTHAYLGGGACVEFDGVDHWLRNLACPSAPRTILAFYQQVTYAQYHPIVDFGATHFPSLRQGINPATITWLPASDPARVNSPILPITIGSASKFSYFVPVIADDTGSAFSLATFDPAGVIDIAGSPDASTDATARPAGPDVLSIGAFSTGSFKTNMRLAALLVLSDSLTAAELALAVAYFQRRCVDLQPSNGLRLVGTRTTRADAQPRLYQTRHEGVSGDTLASFAARMVGTWGGSGGVTIGSADDPGVGNRGFIETLITTQGLVGVVPIVHVGMNDASSGAIDRAAYRRMVQRAVAIAALGPGTMPKIGLCTVTGRNDDDAKQARIDTFNAALPTDITTLVGGGAPAVIVDIATPFDRTTMTDIGGIHYNEPGAQNVGATHSAWLTAQGLRALFLVYGGDSLTEGGTNLEQWASFRVWLV